MRTRLLMLIACVLVTGAAPDNAQRMQGQWHVTALSQDGQPAPADVIANMSMTITADKLIAHSGFGEDSPAPYLVDWSKDPAWIDISPPNEPAQTGIIRLLDDQLSLKLTSATSRPSTFEGPDQKDDMRLTMIRALSPESQPATQSATPGLP